MGSATDTNSAPVALGPSSSRNDPAPFPRLDEIYRAAPICLCAHDTDKRYRVVNDAFARANGLSPEAHVGRTVFEVFPPEAASVLDAALDTVLLEGRALLQLDLPVERPSGRRDLRASCSPLRDAEGALRGVSVVLEDVTALVAGGRQSAARAAKLEALINAVPELVAYVDVDLRYRFMNAAYRDLLGVEPPLVAGRSVHEILSEEEVDRARPHLKRAFAGERLTYENELMTSSGLRIFSATYVPDFSESGSVRGVFVLGRDVTDERRMREAVAASERHLRDTLDRISDAFLSYDRDLRITYANEAAARIFGRAPAELIGRQPWDLFPVGDEDFFTEARQTLMLQEPRTFEIFSEHFGAWYECRSYPSGSGLTLFIKDTSARRRAELEQQRREEDLARLNGALGERTAELEALIAHAPIGLAFFDREHRYLRLNEQLAHVPGEATGSHLGRVIDDVLPFTATVIKPMLDEVFATGRALRSVEVSGETAGEPGVIRHWLAGFFPVKSGSEVRAAGCVAVEISERKRAEVALSRAKQDAEAASLAKSAFVANMSHELRTPMTAILGFTEVLLARAGDDKSRSQLRTIKRNGEHLIEILNDILDLSRIEAGRLELIRERFSLAELIEDVRCLMLVRAQEKRLPLVIRWHGEVPDAVEGDRTRLRQVLVNLIGNAIKFTERGEVRLAVRLEGGSLQLDVEDTGIGMAEGQVRRLFEPFTQADTSVQRRYGGTGLGLSITRRLLDMMGGSIDVITELGAGSTFKVRVPVGEVPGSALVDPARPLERARADLERFEAPAKLGRRVLVVEDQPEIRSVLREYLEAADAEVGEAAHGLEALQVLDRDDAGGRPWAALLVDVQMPVLDGLELTRRLRARGDKRPIIAVTAHAMHGDRERALAAGCDEHLTKPINPATLVDALARLLARVPTSPPEEELRVLIVEDSADLRLALEEVLRALGCAVASAGSGAEAERVAESLQPAVAFLDMSLPDTDGLRLMRKLRQGGHEATRFIALSGWAEPEAQKSALAAGFDRYLTKPVEVSELEEVLERRADRRG